MLRVLPNLLILFLLFANPLLADARLDQLMTKLQKKYENIQTLKANFMQSYRSKRFSDQIVEKGIVYFQKGGRMKWEYQRPETKVFVSDGFFYYYYVPADKQVIKTPAQQGADQHSPTLFLAGRGNFVRDFRAEWADPRAGSHLLKLTPLKPQLDFRYMIADVDPASGLILGLTIIDSYDNRTEFVFQNLQENPKIPPDFFAFSPPPGTDIVFQAGDTQ